VILTPQYQRKLKALLALEKNKSWCGKGNFSTRGTGRKGTEEERAFQKR